MLLERISNLFRRKRELIVLPAALSMEEYSAQCIGREVQLLADSVMKQTQFALTAVESVKYYTVEGREYEVSVAAIGSFATFEEPRRGI